MFNQKFTVMRKLFFTLTLFSFALFAMPSCSPSDSLEDVIEESELDVTTSGEDEDKIAKPG